MTESGGLERLVSNQRVPELIGVWRLHCPVCGKQYGVWPTNLQALTAGILHLNECRG